MNGHNWTTEEDYALHFGAGLGMTGSQIALGIGCTRNAVMGRCHRLHVKLRKGYHGPLVLRSPEYWKAYNRAMQHKYRLQRLINRISSLDPDDRAQVMKAVSA